MTDECDDDSRRTIFKEAGRRAREEERSIARMAEAMRLASFRAYLASAVDMMPTILPDVATLAGIGASDALQRLRPCASWSGCAGRNFAMAAQKRLPSFATLGRRFSATPAGDAYAHLARVGTALLSDGALADWIEIVASGQWLEITMRSKAFELATFEGMARLKVEGRLPDVLLSTCAGRRLEDVVDHPLLRDRSLVIDSAWLMGSGTVLQFRIGGSRVAFPWRA